MWRAEDGGSAGPSPDGLDAHAGSEGGRMKRIFAAFVVLGVIAAMFFAASPAYATYPGHNGRIAFQADTGGGNQIYTVRPNGHDLFQVTHVAGDATTPDWS